VKQSTTKDEKARGLFTPGNPIEPLVGIRTRMVVHDAERALLLGYKSPAKVLSSQVYHEREDFAWTSRRREDFGWKTQEDESELLVDDSTKERSIKGRRFCKTSPTFYQHYQPLTHEVVLVPVEPNELLESQVSDGLR
jgi:hypothetical protein